MNEPVAAMFSAALGLAAILFGVFGFLYTLYATHLTQLRDGEVVPILPRLRTICRLLSVLTIIAVLAAGAALAGSGIRGAALWIGVALVGIVAAAAAATLYLAFRTMGESQ